MLASSLHYLMYNIVREAARAANIWDSTPILKELTPVESKKFYDTVGIHRYTVQSPVCVLMFISIYIHAGIYSVPSVEVMSAITY